MSTHSFTVKVANHFHAYPNRWINSDVLMNIGGRMAWRTRVSDCRKILGMQIENRTRKVGKYTVSEYRYRPAGQQELGL